MMCLLRWSLVTAFAGASLCLGDLGGAHPGGRLAHPVEIVENRLFVLSLTKKRKGTFLRKRPFLLSERAILKKEKAFFLKEKTIFLTKMAVVCKGKGSFFSMKRRIFKRRGIFLMEKVIFSEIKRIF